jgi:hypothetical protein
MPPISERRKHFLSATGYHRLCRLPERKIDPDFPRFFGLISAIFSLSKLIGASSFLQMVETLLLSLILSGTAPLGGIEAAAPSVDGAALNLKSWSYTFVVQERRSQPNG